MKLEVSIGESIDKLSILELKKHKITDSYKLELIENEINAIQEVNTYKNKLPFFYNVLLFVNNEIWEMTDTIKTMNIYDNSYSLLAYKIFDYNQKRFRIKNFFNKLLDSTIQEQKSYENAICLINILDENILFQKLSEIFYLSISYDILLIDSAYESIISNIINIPSIQFIDSSSIEKNSTNPISIINLYEYSISKKLQIIFSLEPIRYINGGMFGDFIHSLSVINENYYKTGRKGILYIANGYGGDIFRYGIENAFNDTFEIISKQNYIISYSIYKDSGYDINLNDWRHNRYICNQNWWFIYNDTYNINWTKHPWITLPNILIKDSKWENKIIVNTTSHRFPAFINFQEKYSLYGDDLVFVTMEESNYNDFVKNTGLSNIPCHLLTSFTELCIILYSCKLFISGLSAPLAIAFAMHTPCIIAMHIDYLEHYMMKDIQKYLPFISEIQ